MITELYTGQTARWPQSGRHIMAQYDAETVVVYQAYCPQIGRFAAEHGYFGGSFSLSRMSWIKPNFLWVMFRCGWATKENQETVLAISIRRNAFEQILSEAVPSTFTPHFYASEAEWKQALMQSDIRLQWDPDHAPDGSKVERRALQIGLRGETLARYAREWIVKIEDITGFVMEQRPHAIAANWGNLILPEEKIYPVPGALAARLGMDSPSDKETVS